MLKYPVRMEMNVTFIANRHDSRNVRRAESRAEIAVLFSSCGGAVCRSLAAIQDWRLGFSIFQVVSMDSSECNVGSELRRSNFAVTDLSRVRAEAASASKGVGMGPGGLLLGFVVNLLDRYNCAVLAPRIDQIKLAVHPALPIFFSLFSLFFLRNPSIDIHVEFRSGTVCHRHCVCSLCP